MSVCVYAGSLEQVFVEADLRDDVERKKRIRQVCSQPLVLRICDRTCSWKAKLMFFVVCFCSLFLLFFGLDSAQNTKGIEMHTNN